MSFSIPEAIADILGSPDLHIKSGSQLRLVCTLRHSTEAPVYVFWYHGDRMINYDKERGVTVRSDRKSSVLAINAADKVDSGNYTCVPSNARAATINVHVLNGTVDGGSNNMLYTTLGYSVVRLSTGSCCYSTLSVLYLLLSVTVLYDNVWYRTTRLSRTVRKLS